MMEVLKRRTHHKLKALQEEEEEQKEEKEEMKMISLPNRTRY